MNALLPPRAPRGFTLLETMVVVAIIGVVAALAGTTVYSWKQKASNRTAALDFFLTLNSARQMALERGSDVWVLVFPQLAAPGLATPGPGAFFTFSDPNMEFALTTCPSGQICYSTFVAPTHMVPTSGLGRLENETYLNNYSTTPYKFAPVTQTTKSITGPFAALFDSGCNFCTGSPPKGAIVFGSEGGARLLDGSGGTSTLKAGVLGFRDANGNNTQHFVISRSTGFIGIFQAP